MGGRGRGDTVLDSGPDYSQDLRHGAAERATFVTTLGRAPPENPDYYPGSEPRTGSVSAACCVKGESEFASPSHGPPLIVSNTLE